MLLDPAFPWTCSCKQVHDVIKMVSSSTIILVSGEALKEDHEFQKEVRRSLGDMDTEQKEYGERSI